ncbi:hypothetical protein PRIPAC_93539 [Pristionchus pacificus]|uniref:Uncharacterized protein n=1 Tax=Pristionchus pacificus TaxID=54126 RepID=A0A2A6BII9_PRIPA|nr:hypothetical protein PRIPAC_93539 [Pristionchus pacificus]|eukprot:PDM65709.1 hypothetical protein PRIPAC_45623 [Pristionchus pacificus]
MNMIEQLTDDQALSGLGKLPAEIRSMIFDNVTASIGELRLVCKSWLEMVNDWLTTNKKPAFLNLAISEENAKFMRVAIEFQNCNAACFLDLWQLCKDMRKESVKRCYARFPHYTQVHLDIPYEGPLIERLSSSLSTKTRDLSIGGHYRTPRMKSPPETDRFLNSTACLLKTLKRATTLSFSRKCLNDATGWVPEAGILYLDPSRKPLFAWIQVGFAHQRSFMLYAASTFETVDITQLNESCFAHNLFLGSHNVNWTEIIVEMLGSGLRGLHLKNVYTPLLDHNDVRHIIEMMMSMNKHLVFSTNIYIVFPANIEFNGIQVKHREERITRDYQMYPVIEITSAPVLGTCF